MPVRASPHISQPNARKERSRLLLYKGPEMCGPTRTGLQRFPNERTLPAPIDRSEPSRLPSPAASRARRVSRHG